ncbi:MAG: serine/threonine-protein phosphatase [Acidothermus sp.]|nr:serine/threonine-protein phosphatase [Acidothermus sp.]MCL6537324.1 protein phosphatase 2C domain-containing protein [Acidothermus sp.]
MVLTLRYAARSEVGLLRPTNQDAVYAGPRLLAVADGMGGHAAGDVASAVTIASLAPLDDDEPPSDMLGALDQAIRRANEQIRLMTEADSELEGMGTTLTALLWNGSRVALAHIGDSRAYLLRDGELTQITEDHTLVQRLIDEGQIDEADAATHPQRSVILRVLTGRPDDVADLSLREVRAGDRFLLCSDGLSGVVSKETIRETLAIPDPQAAVDALVELALRAGAPDNVTCIVCDVVDDAQARPSSDPVIGGSVAGESVVGAETPNSAAARAAALQPRRAAPSTVVDEEPRRPRWRGPVLVALLVLAVAAALFGGTWWYAQHQYYVGTDRGVVVVYQGIKGDVLGFEFSRIVERTDIDVAELPAYQQERLADTIGAPSREAAERIVDQLRAAATSQNRPSASPSPTTGTP